jgi:serine/threonine protein kinase
MVTTILNPFGHERLKICIALSKNLFAYQFAIGRGGFGKVWRVEKKKEKEVYAMKEMSKARVMAKKSVQSVMNELKLLSQMKSP